MRRVELVSRDVRRIQLAGRGIDYVLARRRGRRGVGLKVDARGLTVNAPATLALARIEGFVRECERWILRKLEEWSDRRVPPIQWRDGERLPFLGDSLVLRLAVGSRDRLDLGEGELRATLREHGPDRVHRSVVGWYKRVAADHFGARTHDLALRAGLAPPCVMVSSARTRWGSCNVRREVRLAWRLVKARPALIDYVICHELAHLRHMNHSRAFWAEVERQCPAYRELRKELSATDHLYRAF